MRATIQDMQMRSPLGEDPPTQPSVQPVSDLPNVPVVRFSRTTPPPIAEARNVATKPGIAPVKALTAARADSARKWARATSPPIVGASTSRAARNRIARGLYVLGAVVVAGGLVTAAVVLTQESDAPVKPAPRANRRPRPPPCHHRRNRWARSSSTPSR